MKKVLLFLAVLFSAFFSFAYEFTCPYKNIDEKAKGTYVIKGASSIYYILNEKVYPIDQQRKKLVDSKYSFIPFFDKKFIPSIRYEDFIQFDKHGNAYVLYQIDEYDGFRKSFVFKYDPVKEKSSIFEIVKTNPYALSFTVSDDGEYIFIHYFDRIKKYEGYVSVAAIPTRHPEKIEILLSGDWTEFGHMTLKNLCFDSNTKNLYFNYGNRVNEKDRCIAINSGLYSLKPENGKYLKKNLKKFTSVKHHEVNDLISFCTKNGMTDFGPAVRHIKSACDSKYKPEEIEISLKCFKDFSDYSILYKEDENGKPLTDEAALEYLYKGGPEIFGYFYNFMCWYCNSNDFEYEFTEKIFPCEYLCLVKETGESAYTADRDFVHSIYSIDDGFLFSNKDGLWGLYMVDWKYISIYHITDSKGKFIKRQDDRLKEIRLAGIYDRKSNNLLVTDDYFIFIQSDGKKIYCVRSC